MTTQINFHYATQAEVWPLGDSRNHSLHINSSDGNGLSVYLPPHVAEHTAAAFNRAMQAVPDGDGWTYTTKSGIWHISRDAAMGTVYNAQHDEVTGDNDPAWMFADAPTLIGCMDEIDDLEGEDGCAKCHRLFGADNLNWMGDGWYCGDCAQTEAERERGMAEMAADDKAHAAMERRAGL